MSVAETNGPQDADDTAATADNSEEVFSIPELPSGKELVFLLIAPWDDPFYMGLNAIEIFTDQGTRADVESIETNAEQAFGELSSLLLCKTCKSTDRNGMWMCAYRQETQPITVTIKLAEVQTIAMIRIWNYNESRVYALRGVRRLHIQLDGAFIFKGEISCAFSSETDGIESDTILFTTNECILNEIAEHDVFLTENELAPASSQMDLLSTASSSGHVRSSSSASLSEIQRPTTGTVPSPSPTPSANAEEGAPIARAEVNNVAVHAAVDAAEPGQNESGVESGSECDLVERLANTHLLANDKDTENVVKGKVFHMELASNWGCPDVIGLTGIQFLGADGEPIAASGCQVRCSSTDNTDALSRLINNRNLTSREEDMWLTRWDPNGPPPVLSFSFAQDVELTGVSIWNYNASPEMTYAGVKCTQFYINGRAIVGAVLLRKAPGYVYFDYVQDVMFDRCHLFRPLSSRPNTRSVSGFIFQLRLLSTWGDEFYIGLNGIELFNRSNRMIKLRPQNLAAFPESVNILPSVSRDPRSSDKLIDGVNDTKKAQHMWLTPMLPNRYARIFIIFDTPTFISRIRIYNYRKTPERGVRHIAISADDLIIYSGEVPQSAADSTGILDISLRELS
ncbi:Protein K04F10.2 [Aphelenchoides avenae]|nr:Protein K04F10.2 [Aphelenchus avenae]